MGGAEGLETAQPHAIALILDTDPRHAEPGCQGGEVVQGRRRMGRALRQQCGDTRSIGAGQRLQGGQAVSATGIGDELRHGGLGADGGDGVWKLPLDETGSRRKPGIR